MKRAIQKTGEETSGLIGNKIAEAVARNTSQNVLTESKTPIETENKHTTLKKENKTLMNLD